MSNPFRYFNSSPEVIRLVVMMYVRYPLSLRNVEDLLAERGIDISHETNQPARDRGWLDIAQPSWEGLKWADSGHSTTRVRAERLRSSLWPSTLKRLAAHMGGAGSPSL